MGAVDQREYRGSEREPREPEREYRGGEREYREPEREYREPEREYRGSSKREPAESIVNQYVAWSAAAGFIPIPIIDLGAITLLQVNMVKALHRHYEPNKKFDRDRAKAWISGLLGSGGALVLAVPAGSLVKAIPVVGTIAGMITEPAMAAGATYTIGHIFISYFERGGKFSEFDPRRWEDALEEVRENTKATNSKVERLLEERGERDVDVPARETREERKPGR